MSVNEALRSRAGHEVPNLAPLLPSRLPGGRSWTPRMVAGAMAMVPSGEWWEVPDPGHSAPGFSYRCRGEGLDSTAHYGRVFVARPYEQRKKVRQDNHAPLKRSDRKSTGGVA